jgi:hypothetical protein
MKADRFIPSTVKATMSARVPVTNIVNPCHKTVHCNLKFEGTHPIQLSTAGAYRQNTDATPTLNTNILSPTHPPLRNSWHNFSHTTFTPPQIFV